MDEIATQLGVSKKTIYQSFNDKNELVDAVMADMIEYSKECCQESRKNASNAIEEVYGAIDSMQDILDNMNPSIMFDIERGYPGTFRRLVEYKYSFLFDLLKRNIARGLEEGLYRPEMDTEMIAKVRLEMSMLPFNEELFPKSQYSMLEVHKEMIEFFLFGMVTPKGYKLMTKYQKERSDKDRMKKLEQ